MNNNPDEAYNALFRSYEAANRELAELKKRVVELEAQLVERANSVAGRRVRVNRIWHGDIREGTILRIDNSGRNLIIHLDGEEYARRYHPFACAIFRSRLPRICKLATNLSRPGNGGKMNLWKATVTVWKIAFWALVALSAFTSEPRRELPVTEHSSECHQYEIIWHSPACRLLGIHANTNK